MSEALLFFLFLVSLLLCGGFFVRAATGKIKHDWIYKPAVVMVGLTVPALIFLSSYFELARDVKQGLFAVSVFAAFLMLVFYRAWISN